MNPSIRHALKHWSYILPFIHIPRNESEYEKLLQFTEKLMELSRHKKDIRITSLLNIIAQNIQKYETHRYPTKCLSPLDMLKFLMEQHGLCQKDLPEIGSQTLVSKILNGERQLTVEHIRNLSNRFGVSPAVFIDV